MINALLLLVPQEAWILLIVLAGFLLMLGLCKAAMGLLAGVILLALFSPFLECFVDLLPTWILVLIMFFLVMSLLKFLLGARVADNLIAHLLYDIILMPFRFFGWLFHGSRRRV